MAVPKIKIVQLECEWIMRSTALTSGLCFSHSWVLHCLMEGKKSLRERVSDIHLLVTKWYTGEWTVFIIAFVLTLKIFPLYSRSIKKVLCVVCVYHSVCVKVRWKPWTDIRLHMFYLFELESLYCLLLYTTGQMVVSFWESSWSLPPMCLPREAQGCR